jgi:aspartyl-tRNA(Asn)/glutamyl-tRNA(Gln) amidotransferase subunit C
VALTTDDVKSIAHLARIGLDESALAPLAADLSTVLHLVEQMNAVDTRGVEPMAHPGNASLRLRDDQVTEADQRDSLQAPAPLTEDGYFLVPRVIE